MDIGVHGLLREGLKQLAHTTYIIEVYQPNIHLMEDLSAV